MDPALSSALSELAVTVDGLGVAYTKLSLADVACEPWVDQLSNLPHLRDLSLEGASMEDQEAQNVNQLKTLTALTLNRNALTANPLKESLHAFLQVAKLANNQIASSESLDLTECCPVLHTLDLSHNQLSNLAGIKTTAALKVLSVANNSLSDISGLTAPGLQILDAANNAIVQIEGSDSTGWADLYANLEELNLSGNHIGSETPITGFRAAGSFEKLATLNLGGNKIGSYKELKNLAEWWSHEEGQKPLPTLTKLTLANNPQTDPEREIEDGSDATPFDEGKYPVEVLVYLPKLQLLDDMPRTDEEGEVVAPFPTPEQHEQATEIRTAMVDAEKEAKRLADEEAARLAAEAEAARIAAEKAAAEEAARIAAEEEAARLAAEDQDETTTASE